MEVSSLTSDDVAAALAKVVPVAPDRIVRLFSLVCLRRVRHLLSDTFREALDVAEAHVNGRATDAQLGDAVRAVKRASGRRGSREWAVYYAVRFVPGSPQENAAIVAEGAAKTARDAIPLPVRSEPCFVTHHHYGFTIHENPSDGNSRVLASSTQPPPPDAPPELVADYNRLMAAIREAQRADELEAQRQADAEEAAFRKVYADAQAARSNAYANEIAAQLELIDSLFR